MVQGPLLLKSLILTTRFNIEAVDVQFVAFILCARNLLLVHYTSFDNGLPASISMISPRMSLMYDGFL